MPQDRPFGRDKDGDMEYVYVYIISTRRFGLEYRSAGFRYHRECETSINKSDWDPERRQSLRRWDLDVRDVERQELEEAVAE